jgi:hypothetical protein
LQLLRCAGYLGLVVHRFEICEQGATENFIGGIKQYLIGGNYV